MPNLASLTLQKQAEVAEGEAKLQDCEAALQQADEQLGRTRADYAAAKRRRDWCAADRGQAVARLARAREELNYLRELAQRTTLCSPVRGVLMSAHMNEKPGQYVKEGDLIGEIEEPTSLVAEIKVPEQDVARVAPGLRVEIKARSLPFDTFTGTVDRVAPGASAGDVQSSVTVYCRIDRGATAATDLRPGMTGDARILCERRSLGKALAERVLRVVRTEFWW